MNFCLAVTWPRARLLSLALSALVSLSGCGGGGGGGNESLGISLSPNRVAATVQLGQSFRFRVDANVAGSVSGDVVAVIGDPGGSIDPDVSIIQTGETSYQANFRTLPSLPEGTRTNAITVRLCSNQSCARQYGAASLPYEFRVVPAPEIRSLSPSQVFWRDPGFSLTVSGSHFDASSIVSWNGSPRATQFVSPTQLLAEIQESDIRDQGTQRVRVVNASTGFTSTDSTISVVERPLDLQSISPSSVAVGSDGFVMTLHGQEWRSSDQVYLHGSEVPVTFVSTSELRVQVPANAVSSRGGREVYVFNGTGRRSASRYLDVVAPTLTALSPQSATAGAAAFMLTVSGSEFVDGATVLWNGSARPTTFVSSTQLTARIAAADVSSAGSQNVSVGNNSDSSSNSNVLAFVVNNPAPTLSSISPQTQEIGGGDFDLTVTGTNFVSSSRVLWGGSARSTTYVSPTQLVARISESDIAVASRTSVIVTSPTPGGGQSTAATFTATNPVPSLTVLNARSSAVGCKDFLLLVVADKIGDYSTVLWNGQARKTRLVSKQVLEAEISAADLASAGNASVSIFNASPGGGTSQTASFSISNSAPATTDAVALDLNTSHNRIATTSCPVSLSATSAWNRAQTGLSDPLIVGDRIYLNDDRKLSALDAGSGMQVWGPTAVSGYYLAYSDGLLFIASGKPCCSTVSGLMEAIDAATGLERFSVDLPGQHYFDYPVTALDGSAYVLGAGNDVTLYAVDSRTQSLKWTVEHLQSGDSTPAVSADGVYVPSCGAYSFAPLTGALNWQHKDSKCGAFDSTPVIANGRIYIDEDASTQYAGHVLDVNTGTVLGSFTSSATITATIRFVFEASGPSGGTRLVARNLSDNSTAWTFKGEANLPFSPTKLPVIVNDVVFVASNSSVYALDASTGQLLWHHMDEQGDQIAALTAGGGMLLISTNTKITAYKISNP